MTNKNIIMAFGIGINLVISANAFSQEKGGEVGNPFKASVEEYAQILNSDPEFDDLKKAAAGDKSLAREKARFFVSEYCSKTQKCHPYWESDKDSEIKGEVAVALAKIRLKTIELSNQKYAEALIDFNKTLVECDKKVATLFAQDFKESCAEKIICTGQSSRKLKDLFKKGGEFESNKVGIVHRELSKEEKMVGGEDISFMLNKPLEKNQAGYINFYEHLDFAEPMSIMGHAFPVISVEAKKKLFSSKIKVTTIKSLEFNHTYIPNGIMTLRSLECDIADPLGSDDTGCSIYIGNVQVPSVEEEKNCLVPVPEEKNGMFTSFLNLFKSKKDSVEVNDSARGTVKEVKTEISGWDKLPEVIEKANAER